MPAPLDRVAAIMTSPLHRRAVVVIALVFVLCAAAAAVLFPGRPHLVVFAAMVWPLFFAALHLNGYGRVGSLAVLLFWLVAYADDVNYGMIRAHNVLAYTALLTAIFGAVVAGHRLLRGRARALPLLAGYFASVLVAAVALLYVVHNQMFGVAVTPAVLYGIYQTHSAEVLAFSAEFGGGLIVLAALLTLLVPGYVILRQHATRVKRPPALLLLVLVLISAAIAGYYRDRLRVFHLLASTAVTYQQEIALFRELQAQRAAGGLPITASTAARGETYVVVIGESLNRNHMGLYGYHRNTTPRLNSLYGAGQLLRFTSAYATHTHTVLVLPNALTAANQRNGATIMESPSVVDVARAAGVETHWITNQALYGAWDNLVSILARGADQLVALNRNVGTTTETVRYDDATVAALEQALAPDSSRNRLVVVHLMGSHWRYCDRVPEAFHRFTGRQLDRGEFGWAREEWIAENVNCYDSSVLYNDHVVAELLRVTQRIGGVTGFIYLADHGEDVLSGHGHHSEKFTYPMVEIPLVAWFSEEYQRVHGDRVAALRAHSSEVFPTDFLFDTVLGVAGITTEYRDPAADLSDPRYDTSDVDLRLLGGQRRYGDADNARYHQRANIAKLAAMGQFSRVLPHRINSTGSLAEVLSDGHRALELDVLYRERGGSGYFELGHDDEHASGNALAAFLARMPVDSMTKLWLDVKNLNGSNVDSVRAELARLNAAFDLAPRAIFESPAVAQLRAFGEDGYHTSYYLPTARLLDLSERSARDSLHLEAARIARDVDAAGVAAVSFDARLYAFVKEYLEPRLAPNVVYHTWELDLSFADPRLLAKLARTAFFQDPRVETILLEYRSQYSL